MKFSIAIVAASLALISPVFGSPTPDNIPDVTYHCESEVKMDIDILLTAFL